MNGLSRTRDLPAFGQLIQQLFANHPLITDEVEITRRVMPLLQAGLMQVYAKIREEGFASR